MTTPNIIPRADGEGNIGKPDARWVDVVISGDLTDGTDAVSPAEGKAAYDHSVLTSGNPHAVTYTEAGADQAGTAAAAVASHEGLYDHTEIQNAAKIQGRDVADTAPTDGQAIVWNDGNSRYEPSTVSTLSDVSTDSTLTGDGTPGDPLHVVDDGHDHTLSNISDAGTAAAVDIATIGVDATSAQAVRGDDSRLSDARDPSAHATTHESGGDDEIDHDSLFGYTLDAHTLHSTVTVGVTSDLTGGGTIDSSMTIGLANTTVTAGSYSLVSMTVDGKGRITSATSGGITVTSDLDGNGTSVDPLGLAATTVTAGSYTLVGLTVDSKGRITSATSGGVSTSAEFTGDGTSGDSLTLSSTSVTAGSYTYTSMTVDAKGRVTSASSGSVIEDILVAVGDESSDIVAGPGQRSFRMPFAMNLTGVRASLNTAATGQNAIFDINQNGTSILSTKLSIDDGETTSTTATTPAVISTSALVDDAVITFDIDQIGSTAAGTGPKVLLSGTRA